MKRKRAKQTDDNTDNVLGSNHIDDVRWLCSLSESELDLLVNLKMLVIRRAKKLGHANLANNFNLKVLRNLSFTMMEHLKDELQDPSLGPFSAQSSKLLADCNLSQVHVKENFSSMTVEELHPFICPDKEKRKADICNGNDYHKKQQKTDGLSQSNPPEERVKT